MIWEYKTLTLPSSTERQNMLSEMGLSGWELIGFEQGLAYFKRPKPEVIGDRIPPAGGDGVPSTPPTAKHVDAVRIATNVQETRTVGTKKK